MGLIAATCLMPACCAGCTGHCHALLGGRLEFLIVVALGYIMTEMNTSVKFIIGKDTAINFRIAKKHITQWAI